MRAEKTITKVSRDYKKFARNMAIMKNSMDRASDIYNAKMEGKAEGLAEGEVKGEIIGYEKAQRKYTQEKLEIARKMKRSDLSVEQIQSITGLPIETIESL